MRTTILLALLTALYSTNAMAESLQRRCAVYPYGARICRSVAPIVVRPRTERIMGLPAATYERGLKESKCMPSPAGPGVCGGG